MSFRNSLILINVVFWALVLCFLAWRVLSLKRNPSTKTPENLTPYLDDEKLEGPRLERALGWSLIFVLVVALALPVYFLFEPGRQDRALAQFDELAAERGETLFANDQMEAYDATQSLLCANCHGTDAAGGTAPFVLQPELNICDDPANKSNANVPECLPVAVGWAAPALDSVLLRFDEAAVYDIIEYGRPGTPMPAWGVDSGKGVLNTQSINNLIAYLKSIQISKQEAQERSTKALRSYKSDAAENVEKQAEQLTGARTALAAARTEGKGPLVIAELEVAVTRQSEVLASATRWAAQVSQMSDGEILFRTNCARCHTKGASYADPNNVKLPTPSPNGTGAFGPNLTGGSTLIQFPGVAGVQEQFDWVAEGAPANDGYGVRGISSGRMPHFSNMLTEAQIKAIVAYERSL